MFGGKVAEYDYDWRATAAREFREEVGGLAEVLADEIGLTVRIYFGSWGELQYSHTTGHVTKQEPEKFHSVYVLQCKYRCMLLRVTDAVHVAALRALPEQYDAAFRGAITEDWSRAAVRLEPVLLRPHADGKTGLRVYLSRSASARFLHT